MKIQLFFLFVVLSVVTSNSDESDEEFVDIKEVIIEVKPDMAVDIAIQCIDDFGLLKCFEEGYEYDYWGPRWRSKQAIQNKLSEVANNYIKEVKTKVEYEESVVDMTARELDCKVQVSHHVCMPLENEEEPLRLVGGITGCKEKMRDVCGQRFFDKLKTETEPYPIIPEPPCAEVESSLSSEEESPISSEEESPLSSEDK